MKSIIGKILIATPDLLTDHIFSQAVILIVDQTEQGSMGVIINKPANYYLKDFFKDVPTGFQLWSGGPVEQKHLFIIHRSPDLLPNSIIFDSQKKLCLGGDFNKIKIFLDNKTLTQEDIRFFIGYSGWGIGQLEQEIKEKAWFVTNNDLDIFNLNPKNLWKDKLIQLNPKNIVWKNSPINPNLN